MKNPLTDPSNKIPTLLNKQKGATMVEYAIMIGLVALVAFAVVKALGTKVNGTFNSIAGSFPAQSQGNSGQGNSGDEGGKTAWPGSHRYWGPFPSGAGKRDSAGFAGKAFHGVREAGSGRDNDRHGA